MLPNKLGIQRHGQHIGVVVFCPDVDDVDLFQHGDPDEVVFHVDVPRPHASHWVVGQLNGPLVVLKHLDVDDSTILMGTSSTSGMINC